MVGNIDNWFLSDSGTDILEKISKGKTSGFVKDSVPIAGYIDNNLRFSRYDEAKTALDAFGAIAAYNVSGLITMANDYWYSEVSTEQLKSEAVKNEKNSNIAAHLFLFNSGGGEATDIHTCATAIHELKKPTVAFIKGECNSAAYYLASACDIIVAQQETDIVGSIGIMATRYFAKNDNDFVEKVVLYAPKSKDKNKIFENTPSAIKAYIEKFLVPHADLFINDITAFRPNIKDIDGKVFSGGVYTAKEAIENGLIDKIDTLENTLTNILKITEEKQPVNMSLKIFSTLEGLFGIAAKGKDDASIKDAGEQVLSDIKAEMAQAKADGIKEGTARAEAEISVLKTQYNELNNNFTLLATTKQDIDTENKTLRAQNIELSGLLAAKKAEEGKMNFDTPPDTLSIAQAKSKSRDRV